MTYSVFGGDESAIGEYMARVIILASDEDATWTLTACVNGEVMWVEEGEYFTSGDFSHSFGSSDSSTVVTDRFPVTLDSIAGSDC